MSEFASVKGTRTAGVGCGITAREGHKLRACRGKGTPACYLDLSAFGVKLLHQLPLSLGTFTR